MFTKFVTWMMFLAVSTALLAATSHSACAAPALIAFVKTDAAQHSDIWTMHVDGSSRQRLTTNGRSMSPVWFPDGKRIAFVVYQANDEEDGQLWVMNSDGSGQRRLTTNTNKACFSPTISPNGLWIAFLGMKTDASQGHSDLYLFRMRSSGSQPLPLVKAEAFVTRLEFSPSGTSILCSGNGGEFGIGSIWEYNLASGRTRNVYPRSLNSHYAVYGGIAWAPDGKMFLADTKLWTDGNDDSSYQDRKKDGLLIINAEGSSVHLVLQGNYIDPSWSKDGRQLTFIGSDSSIQTFNLKRHERRILYRDSGLSHPRWQP